MNSNSQRHRRVGKALRARRTCHTCPPGQRVNDYYLPTRQRQCFDCLASTTDTQQTAA